MKRLGSTKAGQRGISFLGLLFVGAVLGCLILVGLQVLPTAVEFFTIQKAVTKASSETTVLAVQQAFDRTASVDNITSITGKDLDITKDGERVVVNFAYEKELHLFGPAFLLIKYSGSSK